MIKQALIWIALVLLRGGGADMVVVYVTLVIYGRRKFEQVPGNLQEAVKAELESMGLGTDGKPLVVE